MCPRMGLSGTLALANSGHPRRAADVGSRSRVVPDPDASSRSAAAIEVIDFCSRAVAPRFWAQPAASASLGGEEVRNAARARARRQYRFQAIGHAACCPRARQRVWESEIGAHTACVPAALLTVLRMLLAGRMSSARGVSTDTALLIQTSPRCPRCRGAPASACSGEASCGLVGRSVGAWSHGTICTCTQPSGRRGRRRGWWGEGETCQGRAGWLETSSVKL